MIRAGAVLWEKGGKSDPHLLQALQAHDYLFGVTNGEKKNYVTLATSAEPYIFFFLFFIYHTEKIVQGLLRLQQVVSFFSPFPQTATPFISPYQGKDENADFLDL